MQPYISLFFGATLFMVAVLLILRQFEKREATPKDALHEEGTSAAIAARLRASQTRRRLQCGIMLAALAIGVMIEPWVVSPVPRVVLGASMLLVVGWMILLAVFDIIMTTSGYRRITNRDRHELIRLEARAKDLLRQQGVKSHPDNDPDQEK